MFDRNRDVEFNAKIKEKWIDKHVTVNDSCQELQRFAGIVGRVVTINFNGRAVIDFQDGGWYDVIASEEFLTIVDGEEAGGKYKNVNSAQPIPDKQK